MKVRRAWLKARSAQFGITLRGSSRRNPPASRSSGSSLHGPPAARAPRAATRSPRRRQRDELATFHYSVPPVLPTERIAHLSYGRRLLRCGISGRIRCSGLGHGTEGDRIARGLDRRDAVLPDIAGGAAHHVERAWLRVERETFPLVADLAAET